jgi:GntR family transcriptional regulator, carbon starvation induced regulator
LDDRPLTQTEIAYRGLRQSILSCELAPGAKVKAKAVCERYDVSLGAAREAFSRLVADGLLMMEAQKGCVVAPVSWEEFEQLNELRTEIEISCLRKAMRFGDLQWEGGVVGALHRLTRLHDFGSDSFLFPLRPEWQDAHVAFHRALVAACPNRVLLDLRENLFERTQRYRYWSVGLRLASGERDVRQEHIDLAERTQARDVDGASAAIEEHFRRTTDALLNAARATGDGGIQAGLSKTVFDAKAQRRQ